MRILITTARFGSGHLVATEALVKAFKQNYKDVEIATFDFSENGNQAVEKFNQKLYSFTASHVPSLYRGYASMMDDNKLLNRVNKYFSLVGSQKQFEEKLQKFRPDIVLSTFPITNRVIGSFKEEYGFKFVTCITDLTTIHNYWVAKEIDKYIVSIPEMVAPLQTLYIPREKIKVLGYPLRDVFFEKKNKRELQKKLNVKSGKFTTLYMLHTAPEKFAEKVCMHLDQDAEVQSIIVCGKNVKLKEKLQKKLKDSQVLGYVENLDEYIRVADLLIGKAGPAFILEGCALRTNVLMTSYIAPQEQGNVALMLEKNAGFLAGDEKEIVKTISEIKKLSPEKQNEIYAGQKKIIHSDGAKDIAKYLVNML